MNQNAFLNSEYVSEVDQLRVNVYRLIARALSRPADKEFLDILQGLAGDDTELGKVFGEVAVFENKPYPASAQVVEKANLIGFKRDDFLDFLTQHPQVALKIINMLSGRLREAQGRIRDLAGERVQQRLTRTLVMLMQKLGPTLPFTREEIADMAGMTTETVIRQMSGLKERGIVTSNRGQITIMDEQKLKLLADGPPQV